MGGMELLGQLGDRLGPGYRDLLQGVAGMALLGMGPKMARLGEAPAPRAAVYNAARGGVQGRHDRSRYHGDPEWQSTTTE